MESETNVTDSTAASDQNESGDKTKEIAQLENLLIEGKQAYISEKFKEAEMKLSEAAELSVNIYGYFAIPTFDPHFYYGKTLLELARLEDDVFTNALKDISSVDNAAKRKTKNEEDENSEKGEELTGHFSFSVRLNFDSSNFVRIILIKSYLILEEEENGIRKTIRDALERNAEAVKHNITCNETQFSDLPDKNMESLYHYLVLHEKNNAAENGLDAETTSNNSRKIQKENDSIIDNVTDMKYANKVNEECTDVKEVLSEGKTEDGSSEVSEVHTVEDSELVSEDITDDSSEREDSVEGIEYLQLAWENLEVARAICDKHLEDDNWKEKKVEVLLDLTDCSTDAENYKQAVDDIDECIMLCESIFHKTDRRTAQAYFVKGRTFNLAKDFQSAAKVFEKSKEILVARKTFSVVQVYCFWKKVSVCHEYIFHNMYLTLNCYMFIVEKLEELLAEEGADDDKEKVKLEIEELKSLLLEIQLKIEDALESAKSMTSVSCNTTRTYFLLTSVVKNFIKHDLNAEGDINSALIKTMENKASGCIDDVSTDDVSSLVRKKSKKAISEEYEIPMKKMKANENSNLMKFGKKLQEPRVFMIVSCHMHNSKRLVHQIYVLIRYLENCLWCKANNAGDI
ncbi:unnamed protein product [Thelazia callipaeda]|uniref:SHNi-TPR domain-containing protein n=1 Tax=Thelazia callipaeda TaxID=103827 RepID=A0A0N5CY26_THECL|nr:unnamed protein product [Thelazia callipaeda]